VQLLHANQQTLLGAMGKRQIVVRAKRSFELLSSEADIEARDTRIRRHDRAAPQLLEKRTLISQITNLVRSILDNTGVVLIGFSLALVGTQIDSRLGLSSLSSGFAIVVGCLLFAIGFLLRVLATFYFYEHQAHVISPAPQQSLIMTGPYHFSRNPLYLGGNVFIFFGAALSLGSPSTLAITAVHLPLVDLFIRRQERQLEANFGEAWERYRNRVRRWI
jgi:protein-S-isoprenylcysteine O-methyltransferase Ste14